MATLISAASTGFTTASTWAVAEGLNPVRNASQSNAFTTAVTTAAFALTTSTFTGVVLFLKNLNANPSGTLTVELLKSGVVQASCVIAKSDLAPFSNLTGILYNEPTFLKFDAPVTADATVTWTLRLTGSSGSTVIGYTTANATTTNFTRLFKTTTQQAPATGDNLYILGEVTSTTQSNKTFNVSMDSTTNTTYGSGIVNTTTAPGGGIHIGKLGALTYPTSENTTSILRIAGDLVLWEGGVFRMGSPANPVPISSTAILEFQPTSVSGDMGFINPEGGTVSFRGSPRTSGKNIVAAKLISTGVFTTNYTSGVATLSEVSNKATMIGAASSTFGVTGPGISNATVGAYNVGAGRASISPTPTQDGVNAIVRSYYRVGAFRIYTDVDTGWLQGDVVGVSSTSQNPAECEIAVLTGPATVDTVGNFYFPAQGYIAPSSALNVSPSGTGGSLFMREGVSSVVGAEVALLTRNVKVRSTSTSLMSYMLIGNGTNPTSLFMYSTELYYMGANLNTKAGLSINGTVGGSVDVRFCSIHNCLQTGVCFNGAASAAVGGWNFSTNVLFNCAVSAGSAISLPTAVNDYTWNISNNTIIRTISGIGVNLNDVGGTFTGNTIAGATSHGLVCQEVGASYLGNFSNNLMHSNGGSGFFTSSTLWGTLSGITTIRNGQYGISLPVNSGVLIDSLVAVGNAVAGMAVTAFNGSIKNSFISSDYVYPQLSGLVPASAGSSFTGWIDNTEFGGPRIDVLAYLAHSMADINITSLNFSGTLTMRNCRLGSPTDVDGAINLNPGSMITSARQNGIAGNHLNWSRSGRTKADYDMFNTAAPSEKISPTSGLTFVATVENGSNVMSNIVSFEGINIGTFIYSAFVAASTYVTAIDKVARTITVSNPFTSTSTNRVVAIVNKAESGSKLIPMDSGGTTTVSVFVKTFVNTDTQSGYNGNPPRLIQKANPALGIPNDIVLATFNGQPNVWTQLSGVTTAPTDDGMIEVLIDCDCFLGSNSYSASYYINIDDWAVT